MKFFEGLKLPVNNPFTYVHNLKMNKLKKIELSVLKKINLWYLISYFDLFSPD